MQSATSLNLLIERTDEYNYYIGGHILEAMQMCNEAGFKALDWNALDYCWPDTVPGTTDLTSDKWKFYVDQMRNKAEQLGMRFSQCHSLMYNYFDKNEKTEYMQKIEDRVLEGCRILGIPRIIYHPEVPEKLRKARDAEGCKKANTVYLRSEAEKAAKYGLEIAVENMFITKKTDGSSIWRYCSRPEELVDLVDTIHMDNVCICLDTGHAHIMNEDYGKTIACYGKRLRALHIADNDQASDQHLMPFHGSIDWESVMKALSDIDYPGELTYEIHNAAVRMPKELRKLMLREIYEVGQWLISRFDIYSKQ